MKVLLVGKNVRDILNNQRTGSNEESRVEWATAENFEELEVILQDTSDFTTVVFIDQLSRGQRPGVSFETTIEAMNLVKDRITTISTTFIASTPNAFMNNKLSGQCKVDVYTRSDLWRWFKEVLSS